MYCDGVGAVCVPAAAFVGSVWQKFYIDRKVVRTRFSWREVQSRSKFSSIGGGRAWLDKVAVFNLDAPQLCGEKALVLVVTGCLVPREGLY